MSESKDINLMPSQAKPWLKYFPEESRNISIPECSAYTYLKKQNEKHLTDTAIHYYGNTISYGKMMDKIEQTAAAYYELGVRPGDIVAFCTVTLPETIYSLYALNKIGAAADFIDPRFDIPGIKKNIEESGAKIVVTIDLAFPKIKRIMSQMHLDKVIVQSANESLPKPVKFIRTMTSKVEVEYSDKVISWKEFYKKGKGLIAPEHPYEKDTRAIITHTGGTTGFPKGVMLTSENLNAAAMNFGCAGLDIVRQEIFLDIMPVFAAYGVVCGIHMPMTLGMKMVLIPKFVPNSFGSLVRKFKPQHTMGVPAFYELLMTSKEMRGFDLSFFKFAASGGDTMNAGLEEKINKFLKKHGAKYPISQGYGMSECSGAASFNFGTVYKSGSVGIPAVTTTIGIFRPDTAEELGCNQKGEVCITGPTVMKGYLNKPEESAYIMREHPDGKVWLHSGDIGYMDEEGFIFIDGRVKHMIIRFDGHKVFPAQIESVMSKHDAVAGCGVIGIQDPDHAQGNLPLAIVELRETEEAYDKEKIRKELFEMSNVQLEERGRPVDIVFIEHLPHTNMGKTDYMSLTDCFREHQIEA